jgi:hypothetical protein
MALIYASLLYGDDILRGVFVFILDDHGMVLDVLHSPIFWVLRKLAGEVHELVLQVAPWGLLSSLLIRLKMQLLRWPMISQRCCLSWLGRKQDVLIRGHKLPTFIFLRRDWGIRLKTIHLLELLNAWYYLLEAGFADNRGQRWMPWLPSIFNHNFLLISCRTGFVWNSNQLSTWLLFKPLYLLKISLAPLVDDILGRWVGTLFLYKNSIFKSGRSASCNGVSYLKLID